MTAPVIPIEPWIQSIVEPTIRDVWRRYEEDVDHDDLLQEAALWWYGPGQKYLAEYITQDEKHVRLRRSIWRWVARYAQQERASRRGFVASDQERYTPMQVLRLLPVALDPDGMPDGGGFRDDGPKPKGNLAEGGDTFAGVMDVRRGLGELTFEDQTFLVLAEDLACDWDRIAANLGTLPDSARRRHLRIAERITRFLNNEMEHE
jgi:hypothetical protein